MKWAWIVNVWTKHTHTAASTVQFVTRRDRYKILTPCALQSFENESKISTNSTNGTEKNHLWFFPRVFYSLTRVCVCERTRATQPHSVYLCVCVVFSVFYYVFLCSCRLSSSTDFYSVAATAADMFFLFTHSFATVRSLYTTKNKVCIFYLVPVLYWSREKSSAMYVPISLNVIVGGGGCNAHNINHTQIHTCVGSFVHSLVPSTDRFNRRKQIKTHVGLFYMTIFFIVRGEVHESWTRYTEKKQQNNTKRKK